MHFALVSHFQNRYFPFEWVFGSCAYIIYTQSNSENLIPLLQNIRKYRSWFFFYCCCNCNCFVFVNIELYDLKNHPAANSLIFFCLFCCFCRSIVSFETELLNRFDKNRCSREKSNFDLKEMKNWILYWNFSLIHCHLAIETDDLMTILCAFVMNNIFCIHLIQRYHRDRQQK